MSAKRRALAIAALAPMVVIVGITQTADDNSTVDKALTLVLTVGLPVLLTAVCAVLYTLGRTTSGTRASWCLEVSADHLSLSTLCAALPTLSFLAIIYPLATVLDPRPPSVHDGREVLIGLSLLALPWALLHGALSALIHALGAWTSNTRNGHLYWHLLVAVGALLLVGEVSAEQLYVGTTEWKASYSVAARARLVSAVAIVCLVAAAGWFARRRHRPWLARSAMLASLALAGFLAVASQRGVRCGPEGCCTSWVRIPLQCLDPAGSAATIARDAGGELLTVGDQTMRTSIGPWRLPTRQIAHEWYGIER